jgi:hypothetical protein
MQYERNVVSKMERGIKTIRRPKIICPSQVGSRKQRSLQFSMHIEIYQLEIPRLTLKDYGQINYDAKACYD